MTTQTQTVKFLHTADWHIRDLQYGRKFRGDDFRTSIRQVIDLAVTNEVDFIINGGDTLNVNRPSETMLDFLYEIHERLKAAGIPMFTVTGNHDVSSPSFLRFPSLSERRKGDLNLDVRFSPVGATGIVCIDHEVFEYKGIRIAGFPAIPFGPRKNEQGEREMEGGDGSTLLEKIASAASVDIAVWHGALEDFVPFPMRDSGSLSELPPGYARAWLLGDIHLRGRKRTIDGAMVSYPGTVEMCDRGEPADKFVDFYQLEPDWRLREFPEPVELQLETRPVIFLTVADDGQADQALSKIRKTIADNPGQSPLIFARYAREQRSFINRVNELIDPKDTVFRAAAFSSNYRGPVHAGKEDILPALPNVVDEVIPQGTPLNALARKLVLPGAQFRHEIVSWVESTLHPAAEQ